VRLLGLEGCEVVLRYVREGDTVAKLTSDAASFDRIVAAGGDGTASAVCYATRMSKVPLLVFPAGTANLLASNLALPFEPPALAHTLTQGPSVDFDLGELEFLDKTGAASTSGFMIMAGTGYDAQVMQDAALLKPAFGAAAYLVSAVSNLIPVTAAYEFVVDGKRIESDGIAILLVNFGRIQFDLPVTPDADPRDGKFEVAVLRTKTAVGLLPALTAAVFDKTGKLLAHGAGMDMYRGSSIKVTSEPPMRAQADGDVLRATTPFSARSLPQATRLLVPPGSFYAQFA